MSEIDLSLDDIFNFSKGKRGALCEVKFCRKPRIEGRRLCERCKKTAWRARNPTKSAYRVIKDRARLKKLSFTITFEDFVQICEATGYIEGKGNAADALHLDRIDPHKGYDLDNVRVITCSENSRKGSYEKRIQLSNGRWVTLQEIGLGVPLPPEDGEDDEALFNELFPARSGTEPTFEDVPKADDLDDDCPF